MSQTQGTQTAQDGGPREVSPVEQAQAIFDGLQASFDDIVAAKDKATGATAARAAADQRAADLKTAEAEAIAEKESAKDAFATKADGMVDGIRQLKELAAAM